MKIRVFHKSLFLLLAINYFAFQVELFEDEYKENHRPISSTLCFEKPSLNWESFDKTNAPKAFVLNVDVTIELLGYLCQPGCRITPPFHKFDIIRDKSPPIILSNII